MEHLTIPSLDAKDIQSCPARICAPTRCSNVTALQKASTCINIRLHSYRNSSLTPRTKRGHSGVGKRSIEAPFLIITPSAHVSHSIEIVNGFWEVVEFLFTPTERLSQSFVARSSLITPAQYAIAPYSPAQPKPDHNRKSAQKISPLCFSSTSVFSMPYQDNSSNMRLTLAAAAPDVLQQTIALCQSVQGIIAFAHCSYEAAKCVHLVLAGVSSVLVNLSDGELNRSVVLCLDNAVCGAALSWDVPVGNEGQYQFP